MKNYCDSPEQKYKNVCLTGRDKRSSFTLWDHVTTYLIKAASWWFPRVHQWSWGRLRVPGLLSWLEKFMEVKSKSWVSSNFEKPKGREETFFFVPLKPCSFFFLLYFFYITLFLKSKLHSWRVETSPLTTSKPPRCGWTHAWLVELACRPSQFPALALCLCLLSEGQWIRTPPLHGTCTHTLSRSFFWSPTQLSASPACQIHHKPWILYLGACEGQKLILTSWVTSCFTVWKLQPNPFIFMDWFKFCHCTLVPTGDWGRHRSLFWVSGSCPGATRWATWDLHDC